jgi:hypothetical protein
VYILKVLYLLNPITHHGSATTVLAKWFPKG